MSESSPPPPDVLPEPRAGEVRAVSTLVWRQNRRAGRHPVRWDQPREVGPLPHMRFDHHAGPGDAVAYAAVDALPRKGCAALDTVIAEAWQATRVVDPWDDEPCLVAFAPERPLRLLDLGSGWLTRASGTMAVASGLRAVSRQWAVAVHRSLPDLDGLLWPSSVHGPGDACVLTERSADAWPSAPSFHRPLADPAVTPLLLDACDRIGFDLVDRASRPA